jgi:hypothetical protein
MPSQRRNSRGRFATAAVVAALTLLMVGLGAHAASADSYVQQAEALAGSGSGGFGESVAVSGDGATVLVGAPSQTGGERKEHKEGVVYVFVRSHGAWVQQGGAQGRNGTLATPGGFAGGAFGTSVALSGDGNTALVGSPDSRAGAGLAWVFTRSGASWSESQKLVNNSSERQRHFGGQVALSADDGTAVVGVEGQEREPAVLIFTRSGSTWSAQQRIEGVRGGLALSSDGSTLLVGSTVFVRSGSTWSQQGPPLSGSNQVGASGFGASVALSADGATAFIGGPEDHRCTSCVNSSVGATWAFTRSGSTWSQQGGKLTATGMQLEGHFGESVALSANGNIALVGGPGNGEIKPAEPGAVYVLERSGSAWTQRGQFVPSGPRWQEELENGPPEFGTAVATSSSGRTVVVASSDFEEGWASVFAELPTVTAISPSSGSRAGGTSVSITGTGFTEATGVSFGEASASSFKVNSDTSITAVAPAGVGTVDVTVSLSDPGESATNEADEYTYESVPEFGRCEKTAPKTGQFKNAGCTKLSRTKRGSSNWRRGPGATGRFTSVLESPAFESVGVGKTVIACAGGVARGAYTGARKLTITSLTLSGCAESPPRGVKSDCQTTGAANGEIVGNELTGTLGVISHAKRVPSVGLRLRPISGQILASFECGGASAATGLGSGEGIAREVIGSVIGKVATVDKMTTSNTITYRTSAGRQEPDRFEGGAASKLTTLVGLAQSPEPTTFSAVLALSGEEPLEVDALG